MTRKNTSNLTGKILYFIPPSYADGEVNNKKRYMLVIFDGGIELKLLNISSMHNKPNCLTYECNFKIRIYKPPLKLPSFVKMDSLYILKKFDGIEKLIYSDGGDLNKSTFNDILNQYNKYSSKNSEKIREKRFCKDDIEW